MSFGVLRARGPSRKAAPRLTVVASAAAIMCRVVNLLAFAPSVAAVACGSHAGVPFTPGAPPGETRLVLGIQSEPLGGAIQTFHVVTTVDGALADDTILAPSALPHEIALTPGSHPADSTVAVRIDGYLSASWTPQSTDAAQLVRTAETHFVVGHQALLRVTLQGQCLLALPFPMAPPGGPACASPETCISGSCQSDQVPAQSLEPYDPHWADNVPDICKPLHAGAPVVQVGTGQTDFLPVSATPTVQMEQGPQGGHHVWIAVRQQNLKQSGSTTTITSVQPGGGLVGPNTSFVFTFDPDEGGFCKLSGLRYQLDVDGADYHAFLGKPLDVTVTIADRAGAQAFATTRLNIDPQLLCPTGIAGCP